MVIGAVERKQTLHTLSHVLLDLRESGELIARGTDLEIEITAHMEVEIMDEPGAATIPGRKVLEIAQNLPPESLIELHVDQGHVVVTAGSGDFRLKSFEEADFPKLEGDDGDQGFQIEERHLRELLRNTSFAMAQQDVRYYLNGLLLELAPEKMVAVATDGHRLAYCAHTLPDMERSQQLLLPRKSAQELQRLLADSEDKVTLTASASHIAVRKERLLLRSKLINGKFPNYQRVIPSDNPVRLLLDRERLLAAINRVAILASEKSRAINFKLIPDRLEFRTSNTEQEQALETLEVNYSGEVMEIAFNVGYLRDAIAAIDGEEAALHLKDSGSSCLVTAKASDECRYVVMPMRI